MAVVNARQFEDSLFREVHKNSWLTQISCKDSRKKKERVWTVFCIHDEVDPYLETYSDNKLAILHKPIKFITLSDTKYVSPTICAHEQEFEFAINMKHDLVRLAASTRELMLDWVETLKTKLHELQILQPKENLYTKLPEPRSAPLLPTRDPTSPLPPPPTTTTSVQQSHALELNSISSISITSEPFPNERTHPVLQRGTSLPENGSDETNSQGEIFNFELTHLNDHSNLTSATPSNSRQGNAHYEQLFQLPVLDRQSRVQRSNSSPRRLQPPPQPYRTLREQQVLELQKEIKHPAGIRLQIRRKDCISSIALGDAMGGVWVCGWKQREHPMLYNFLHIGDQLVNIEGTEIHTASDAHKVLRSTSCSLYVNMIIKRVPFGQVFVIRRDLEGQSLGIIQEGNTAVVQNVEPGSLASRHGLSSKAPTCDGLSFTNWVLTEINGRPLNLFFKENQVKDRLNSVGRDISILVQPLDLIKQIKKQLKSIRNYKEYILQ